MALKKKYKPGQLVTIDNRVYRVCKTPIALGCHFCDLCATCSTILFVERCGYALGFYGYLKLIKL